jgi:hypothetical protein
LQKARKVIKQLVWKQTVIKIGKSHKKWKSFELN